jgi:hypothetical protein
MRCTPSLRSVTRSSPPTAGLPSAQMMSYSEAFTKIQHATGIEEFDELMMTFINAEDENYRHYKYIDELTQEIERLKEQIVGVQEEIEQYATGDQDESAQQVGGRSVVHAGRSLTRGGSFTHTRVDHAHRSASWLRPRRR